MNNEAIAEYAYLWDGSEKGWVVLEMEPNSPSVFNEEKGILLHIESSEVNQAVCAYMKKMGIKTINEVPVVDLEIEPID